MRALLVVLVVGAVAASGCLNAVDRLPSGEGPVAGRDCPGHWHSTFHVWIGDVFVPYDDDAMMLETGGTPFRYHLHVGEGGEQIHWEPRPSECLALEDFFAAVDTVVEPDALHLSERHAAYGLDGTYPGTVHAYEAAPPEWVWGEVRLASFLEGQPVDGARTLLVVGDLDEATLRERQESVPVPPTYRAS